ncbi:MAG: hypothetical protein RQ754_02975 [Desulfuromonadales bacterium]|nr:hypothetical protein [Desulfuromonadales bacterium]
MIHRLSIDMEKECIVCGREGATSFGELCLYCATEKALEGIDRTKDYRKDSKYLPVQLTPTEIEEYGKELADVIVAKGELECERAAINKKIKPLVERLDTLAPIVKSGEEERDVECRWYYNWPSGERYLIRMDTAVLVETDVIPEWERQQELSIEDQPVPDPENLCAEETCEHFTSDQPNRCGKLEYVEECELPELGAALAAARKGA